MPPRQLRWLTDAGQVDATVEAKREKLPWGGAFWASFGVDEQPRAKN